MTRVVIVGDVDLPEGLDHGDCLTVAAVVSVWSDGHAHIDATGAHDQQPRTLPGERVIETIALALRLEQVVAPTGDRDGS